eukprot:TRINITY_DN6571_c0_g4_i1.p3 TRINITY_DN6571_c0_g4~~TRINITY_DN6571_c0_g4_i1.p3  ORF type:complete len:109 (+),score=7.41 TRINITY_DN6571_c0_g4_i1:1018-1344(+)
MCVSMRATPRTWPQVSVSTSTKKRRVSGRGNGTGSDGAPKQRGCENTRFGSVRCVCHERARNVEGPVASESSSGYAGMQRAISGLSNVRCGERALNKQAWTYREGLVT